MGATTIATPSVTPTSGAYRFIYAYDTNAPQPLLASVVTAGAPSISDFSEIHVTCADPCPSSFIPETITHSNGSVWGGHRVVSKTTTAWDCILGSGWPGDEDQAGQCYTTTLTSGEPIPTTGAYKKVTSCEVDAHSKMMYVTAGFEEFFKPDISDTRDPQEMMTLFAAAQSSSGCFSAAPATTTSTTESKPTSGTATMGSSGAGSSSSSPSPTQDKPGGASTISRGAGLVLGMFAVSMALQL